MGDPLKGTPLVALLKGTLYIPKGPPNPNSHGPGSVAQGDRGRPGSGCGFGSG